MWDTACGTKSQADTIGAPMLITFNIYRKLALNNDTKHFIFITDYKIRG